MSSSGCLTGRARKAICSSNCDDGLMEVLDNPRGPHRPPTIQHKTVRLNNLQQDYVMSKIGSKPQMRAACADL